MHAPLSRRVLTQSRRGGAGRVLTASLPEQTVCDASQRTACVLPSSTVVAGIAGIDTRDTVSHRYFSLFQRLPERSRVSRSAALPSLSDMMQAGAPAFEWGAFRRLYEARYLGAFDGAFISLLIQRRPHAAARLACTLVATNPKHVAQILEVFGKEAFEISPYATRLQLKSLAGMLTNPELGAFGSTWLFNEIQRQLSDWRCNVCDTVNPSSSTKCRLCSNTSFMWECGKCGLYNRGSVSTCEGCAAPRAEKVGHIASFRWRCESCSFINPTHRLDCARCSEGVSLPVAEGQCTGCGSNCSLSCFPWCDVCGKLQDGCSARVWSCQWCESENHSLCVSCVSCGEERGGAAPGKDWYQWSCGRCELSNPFWGQYCRSCGTCRAERSLLPLEVGKSCTGCGISVDGPSSVCALCADRSDWVCTTDACMSINGSSDTTCRRCGVRPLLMLNDDALQWSPGASTALYTAIVFGQSTSLCSACGDSVASTSTLCPACTMPQPPTSRIGSWLALKALHDLCVSPLTPTSIASIESACEALCGTLPKEMVPWCGVDIEAAESCESPTSPVTLMGKRHFGIRTLTDIIVSLTELAEGEGAGSSARRVLLKCAVDLVALSNSTTDFDEIGFDALKALCGAIRPHQKGIIDTETRIHYLINMKLSREALVNETCCQWCLRSKEGIYCGCKV